MTDKQRPRFEMPGRFPDARRGEDGQLRIGGGQIRVKVTTKRVGGGQLRIPDAARREEQRQRYIAQLNDHRPKIIRVVSEPDLNGPIEPDDDLFEPINLDDDA
jgi:hypothetical protein